MVLGWWAGEVVGRELPAADTPPAKRFLYRPARTQSVVLGKSIGLFALSLLSDFSRSIDY